MILVAPVVIPLKKDRKIPKPSYSFESPDLKGGVYDEVVLNEFKKSFYSFDKKHYHRFKKEIFDSINRCDKSFLKKLWQENYAFKDLKHLSLIEKPISCPTLVICAKQDLIVGFEDQFNLLKDIKNLSFHLLNHSSHYVYMEREKLFFKILNDWILDNFK